MANGIGSSLDASLPEQIESRRAEHRRTLYSSAVKYIICAQRMMILLLI
ncbi:hypothetical protein NC652_037276 [Populus alba x Populus x berolinensis]|nr:hypothetical protein NC652_037276 [Populus alba x Populus x berolinensis]